MSQIQPVNLQLIVENAMRQNGYSGPSMENAWINVVSVANGTTVTNSINLQNLRDAIAQSIYDAMTNRTATGMPSLAAVPGTQVVNNVSEDISLLAVPESYMPNLVPGSVPYPAVIFKNINLNYDPLFPPPLPISELGGILDTKNAARVGDGVQINSLTDPPFITLWVTILQALYIYDSPPPLGISAFGGVIFTAINTYYGGPPTPVNVQISGIIANGSNTVHIGD